MSNLDSGIRPACISADECRPGRKVGIVASRHVESIDCIDSVRRKWQQHQDGREKRCDRSHASLSLHSPAISATRSTMRRLSLGSLIRMKAFVSKSPSGVARKSDT